MSEKLLPCRGCGLEPFWFEEINQLKCPTTDCAYSEMGARPFAEWQRIHAPTPQWQPGPPKEPGLYVCHRVYPLSTRLFQFFDSVTDGWWLPQVVQHYPIPQPPEVTNG